MDTLYSALEVAKRARLQLLDSLQAQLAPAQASHLRKPSIKAGSGSIRLIG